MAVDYLRVKAERIARGYTQDYMAKQLGWSDRARYAKRENGFVSFDADELAKVAEVLGISKDDIGIFFYIQRSLKRTTVCFKNKKTTAGTVAN